MQRSLKRKIARLASRTHAQILTAQARRSLSNGEEQMIGGVPYVGRPSHFHVSAVNPDGTPGPTFYTKGVPFVRMADKPHLSPTRL